MAQRHMKQMDDALVAGDLVPGLRGGDFTEALAAAGEEEQDDMWMHGGQ